MVYLIGHSDELPFSGSESSENSSNYQLSLARAKSVYQKLNDIYDLREVKVLGMSDNHASPLIDDAIERRVDIVITDSYAVSDIFMKSY